MADEAIHVSGALIGWRRTPTDNGCVIELQVASSAEQVTRQDFDHVRIALNDRQLRSLTRDLMRASRARGIQLWAERRLFGRRIAEDH